MKDLGARRLSLLVSDQFGVCTFLSSGHTIWGTELFLLGYLEPR